MKRSLLICLVLLLCAGCVADSVDQPETDNQDTITVVSPTPESKPSQNETVNLPKQEESSQNQVEETVSEAFNITKNHVKRSVEGLEMLQEHPIYDKNLNEIGFVYTFSFKKHTAHQPDPPSERYTGYAITFKNKASYLVLEVGYFGGDPYETVPEGAKRVYSGLNGFFYYADNGMLIHTLTMQETDPSSVNVFELE